MAANSSVTTTTTLPALLCIILRVCFLVSLSLSLPLQSIESVLSEDSAAGGNPVAQILYDASVQRFGTPQVGIALMVVVLLGVFFCNVATLTYVSR